MERYVDFDCLIPKGKKSGPVLAITAGGRALAGEAVAAGGGSLVFIRGAHAFALAPGNVHRLSTIVAEPGKYAHGGDRPYFVPGPVVVPAGSVELAVALPEGWKPPAGT